MTVTADVKVSAPVVQPSPRIFFVQRDGTLARRDPRQTTIFDPATGEVISVDVNTGEAKQ